MIIATLLMVLITFAAHFLGRLIEEVGPAMVALYTLILSFVGVFILVMYYKLRFGTTAKRDDPR